MPDEYSAWACAKQVFSPSTGQFADPGKPHDRGAVDSETGDKAVNPKTPPGGETVRERITLILILASFCLSLGTMASAAETQQWLHVRVVEGPDQEDNIAVNLPLNLIEMILANIESDEISEGVIHLDDMDFDIAMARAVLKAVVDSDDGEFMTVESSDRFDVESIKVLKKDDELKVLIEEDGEQVDVRMPISVLKALVQGDDADELDILGALNEMARQGDSTLVTVDDGESKVRVWIDSSMQGI